MKLFLLCLGLTAVPVWLCASIPGAAADGVTDDTAVIQHAIDTLPAYGVLDGGGASYLTGTLNLKARMAFQNFHLTTRASAGPAVPVNIDGTVVPITDVTINNVAIDGNRHMQTNLAAPEDGARDGIRVAGVAQNIWILNSSAINCGTDGLMIFSAAIQAPLGSLNFTNIYVMNSSFNNNRRHGVSLDSIRNVMFVNVTAKGNGLAAATGSNVTEGDSAYLVNGMLYGSGVVLEEYTAGGSIDQFSMVNCTATGNARFAVQFWDNVAPNAAGFVPRSNIRIESSFLSAGVSPTHGGQAIEFNAPSADIGLGTYYRNVLLSKNQINGTIIVNAAEGFGLVDDVVNSPYAGFYGITQSTTDIVLQAVSAGGKILVQK